MTKKIMNLLKFNKKETRKIKIKDLWVLLLSGGIFTALSFGNMSRWSIWFDEAFSTYLVRFNYFDVAKYTSTDVHPPLYYWILKAWSDVFGKNEIGYRSLSWFVVLTTIFILWFFLNRYFGKKAANMSVVLVSISPLLLRYSEEARMYGLATLIVVCATWVLFELVKKPTKKKYISYAILISLGMWTHYYTALMWLSHWIWRYFTLRKSGVRQKFWTKGWILSHILAVGLFTPWIYLMIKQLGGVQGNGFWIGQFNISTPFAFIGSIFMYRNQEEATGWYALLGIISLIIGTYLVFKAKNKLQSSQKSLFNLILIMVIAPVAMLTLLSMPPLQPSFIERYLVASVPFWYALVGVSAAVNLRKDKKEKNLRKASIFSIFLIVVMSVTGIFYLYKIGNYNKNAHENLPIRPVMDLVKEKSSNGEPIVANSSWRFYEIHNYQEDNHPVYFEATDSLDWGSYDMLRYNDYRKVKNTEQFARENGGKIWYVGSWEYGKYQFPVTGKWEFIQEVKAPNSNNSESMIRAVEIKLVE